MKAALLVGALLGLLGSGSTAHQAEVTISTRTADVESDWSAVYYHRKRPLLLGNDGEAATGGFHLWELNGENPLKEVAAKTPGRTKLLTTLYDLGGKDVVLTIAQPDSYFRIYELSDVDRVRETKFQALGDWSALCPWKSRKSGEQYFYLFGKGQAVQFLIRKNRRDYEILEVQTFSAPLEASSCAVSESAETVYFSGDDDKTVYAFKAAESTVKPDITVAGESEDDITGLASYIGTKTDYLLVAQTDVIGVFSTSFSLLGSIQITGEEDLEIQGLSMFQGSSKKYPAGALAYAYESGSGAGFAVSSIQQAFKELKLQINTNYDPAQKPCSHCSSTVCDDCNGGGFCAPQGQGKGKRSCSCFAGFDGPVCKRVTCQNNCSGNGKCVGPNQCKCDKGWGGLFCSFVLVQPVAETDANGGDGDDPAIWIAPGDTGKSKIITTTKSAVGAGLGVFDLNGRLEQTIPAGEPNNVDVIYGFPAGNRTIDLVYAACRADDTLCLFEMTSSGTLTEIAGGIQPTKEDFSVYGSCVYHSPKTDKFYLFVNAKTSEYLQFELTWSDDALQTRLVRSWFAGSGGQVEGCVADDKNGRIFIGEEPSALWRYGAEPEDDTSAGTLVAKVGDGKIHADVEGVTLVEGKTKDEGYILVSSQGVSAYNVYKRAAPHDYVMTFTITASKNGKVDAVSNTDGIAAVGTKLGKAFPRGLFVTHDDANELPQGGTSAEASFKLVDLGDILGADQIKKLRLLDDVDHDFDPRA